MRRLDDNDNDDECTVDRRRLDGLVSASTDDC